MRIKIILESPKSIVLQVGFNSIIQWFIYSNIKDLWLHDIGFKYGKRQFKLFCFSSFLEKAQFINEKKLFIFPKIVSFIFSSPVDWIIENLASKSFTTKKI
ncbi:MAG: CRISPR-associated endoribonuclease Cas6, partial [Desulfurella sp.]